MTQRRYCPIICLDSLLQIPHVNFGQDSRCTNRDSKGAPPPSQHISTTLPLHLLGHPSYFCSWPIRSVQVLNYTSTWVKFLAIEENKETLKANSQRTVGQSFVAYSVCRHVKHCTHVVHTHTHRRTPNSSCKVILTPNAIHHPRQTQRANTDVDY